MTLPSGTRLGPYEIVASIGAGGMGEVYKARDTRLERTVAIKVLPTHLSSSEEGRQRFEREAKVISSLSHPHICALYDVGREGDVEYLVMEFLEGETLADRLGKGPLSAEQTLRSGAEICGALDCAHRHGIIHRDLKPANVMLTRSGVKLLDFGLARVLDPQTSGESRAQTSLPTRTNLTEEGTILGTFQYMAPEQLEGREADARTDLFAFGSVLYEMATGQKAFTGESQASLISAILRDEPKPISQIRSMSPPALDRVARKCLAKAPDDRWQSAADLKSELDWIREGSSAVFSGSSDANGPVRVRRRGREIAGWTAAALLITALGALAALAANHFLRSRPERRVLRFHLASPPGEPFSYTLAVSPDGRFLAFTSRGAQSSLWIHSFETDESRRVAETADATYPFWSPDSGSIAFFAQGVLKRVDVRGGPPSTICDAGDPRGGTWSTTGEILFSPSAVAGLYSVSATAGGSPSVATTLDSRLQENSHRWPVFLPDGRRYLFLVSAGGRGMAGVYVGRLGSASRKKILPDSTSVVLANGYLLFRRQNRLVAQRFDQEREEVTGEPVTIAESPRGNSGITGLGVFSASSTGLLAYRSGEVEVTSFSWMDRAGSVLEAVPGSTGMVEPALSPDQKRVAWHRGDPASGGDDIWIADFARGTSTRLTFDAADEVSPIWSPDGTRLAISSSRGGTYDLYEKPAGGGEGRLILHTAGPKYLDDWSADGKYLLYEEVDPKTLVDLWVLPLFGDRKPFPFVRSRFNEAHAQFSRDGRWIAYASDEGGRAEIFVQPFPPTGAKWQISNSGGDEPAWRADGKELFYFALDRRLMAVPTDTRNSFDAGVPRALFQAPIPGLGVSSERTQYAATPDGQRFLVRRLADEKTPSSITVVLDWAAALEKR